MYVCLYGAAGFNGACGPVGTPVSLLGHGSLSFRHCLVTLGQTHPGKVALHDRCSEILEWFCILLDKATCVRPRCGVAPQAWN